MSQRVTRRAFARVAGAAALGASAGPVLGTPAVPPPSAATAAGAAAARVFPNGFLWVTATASYQIEGAV